MAKTKSYVSFCAGISIGLVLVVACLIVVLKRDKSSKEIATETMENPQETKAKLKKDITVRANSTSRTESKSTKHSRREFCRKCCHTPPCWYKNHKECSKCANKDQLKLHITRILQRSHKKAVMHHQRRTGKTVWKH